MSATDAFASQSTGLTSPPTDGIAVTPDDGNDLPFVARGISFAGAGDLKVTFLSGRTATIPNGALAAGAQHSMRVTRVWATGTAATGIFAYQ
jgi:hypothetical protein